MPRVRVEASTPTTVVVDGVQLLAFGGASYLGLAHHPEVLAAARAALADGPLSTAASRETSGNHVAHERLEQGLAEFLRCEDAVLTSDGYLADLAAVQALADQVHVALIDADAHPSLFDAARAAGTTLHDFGPGDLTRAHALIDRHGSQGIAVLTDGVFPMHGRIAAANELLRMLPRADAWLLVDDSHTLGVLGDTGRGTREVYDTDDERLVVTASLAKALGVAGGVVAGTATVVARVRNRADAYVGTTPVPPALAAAALVALDVIVREPERIERLHANTSQLHRIGRRLGIEPRGSFLPVLVLPVEGVAEGQEVHATLRERGLFVPFVLYPGAPDRGAFKISVTSEHTAADLRRLEQALAEVVG